MFGPEACSLNQLIYERWKEDIGWPPANDTCFVLRGRARDHLSDPARAEQNTLGLRIGVSLRTSRKQKIEVTPPKREGSGAEHRIFSEGTARGDGNGVAPLSLWCQDGGATLLQNIFTLSTWMESPLTCPVTAT